MASIDVVIPNYQYGRYLRQCVASVVDQDIRDLRILIIDNASSDDSVEVARQLSAEDPRIEVRAHSTNVGAHASINEGVDWAASDYFMILCADDLLPPGALSRAVAIMERCPEVSFAYGTCIEYREDDECPDIRPMPDAPWTIETGTQFIRRCCRTLPYVMSPLVRTRSQKRAGHYRPDLPYNDDTEILLRLAGHGDVAITPAVQAIQRLHQANISREVWNDPIRGIMNNVVMFDIFFQGDGKNMPDSANLRKLALRNAGQQAYWRAMKYIVRGRYQVAIDLWKCAIWLTPSAAIVPPLSYLMRIDQPFHRIAEVIFKSLRLKRAG